MLQPVGAPVAADDDDLGGVGRVVGRGEERRAQRAGAGEQDGDPGPRDGGGGGHAATLAGRSRTDAGRFSPAARQRVTAAASAAAIPLCAATAMPVASGGRADLGEGAVPQRAAGHPHERRR